MNQGQGTKPLASTDQTKTSDIQETNMFKRTLLICTALLACDQASAQGSMTIFGMMDAGITYVNNSGGKNKFFFDDGNYYPNMLGFLGQEDLGGGTKAVFELVNQFSLANGSTIPDADGLFNRTAYVGLDSGTLGRLTFGTQYDFMKDQLLEYDASLYTGGFYNFRDGPFQALKIPDNATGSWDFDRVGGSSRVSNSVRYRSIDYGGFSFGLMYGFGNVAGAVSTDNTVSAALEYKRGGFGIAAAYTDVKYPQMDNGHEGIRNWGVGTKYDTGKVLANVLYTNTRNTLTGAEINAIQLGANWRITPEWSLGGDYQYMKGNAELSSNKAHEVTASVMYWLSKRTTLYAEGIYQRAIGGNGPATAWINGLLAPSSTGSQILARIGMATTF
ncbi:porin [Paraburkholderia madseniana]|uniref:Porin n=2 Tax=Burkholderiaceae TaxID=119060 RepID=A0AAP5BB27_9BURK|nr:porin [Paraburkholderia madseniana]MDN7148395.1 porin [Paraburkholderia sp. WS6]MDQ6407275.1 porin [Paraburkholderia madseniana]